MTTTPRPEFRSRPAPPPLRCNEGSRDHRSEAASLYYGGSNTLAAKEGAVTTAPRMQAGPTVLITDKGEPQWREP